MTRPASAAACSVLLLATLFVPAAAQRGGSDIPTETIFDALGAREGLTICEIGAGDGELSLEAARRVGPAGRVYTSELGSSRLGTLRRKVEESGLERITVVEGTPARTNFPDSSCDAVFMRNVYHHFEDPAAMNASIAGALKPGGRLAVVDFSPPGQEARCAANRDEDGEHGVRRETVSEELRRAGFRLVASETGSGRWFMVVAEKPLP